MLKSNWCFFSFFVFFKIWWTLQFRKACSSQTTVYITVCGAKNRRVKPDKQSGRQTDSQPYVQSDRQKDRQTDTRIDSRTDILYGLVMSNQRFFKIVCFRFPTNVPKKIEYIRFWKKIHYRTKTFSFRSQNFGSKSNRFVQFPNFFWDCKNFSFVFRNL